MAVSLQASTAALCSGASTSGRPCKPAARCSRLLHRSSFLAGRSALASTRLIPTPSAASRRSLTLSAELKVGDRLQDNSDYYRVLKSSDGQGVALSNFQNKKPVVVFFYPKAATPGCTKQACGFRDKFGKFKDAGAEVFGISADAPEVNAQFAKDQRLPFPLLTDQNGFLRKSFGIKGDLLGLLPGRQTYVIDKKGTVVLSFNDQLNTDKHIEQALAAIQKL